MKRLIRLDVVNVIGGEWHRFWHSLGTVFFWRHDHWRVGLIRLN